MSTVNPDPQIVIAELNGDLITVCNGFDGALNHLATNKVNLLPSIHLESDSPALSTTCLPRPEPTPYLQALVADKATRSKERLKNYVSSAVRNTAFAKLADITRGFMDEDLSPPDPNRKAMLPENDTDKLLAWHPHKQMLAVAQPDGTVYIYENDEKALDWHQMVLRHQLMQSITCIEWKQRANGTLAVGCRNGVCIWTLGDNPKESVSMNYVCYPGYGDITSIAWDPTPASHLLVAASRTAGTLVVFDLLFMRSTPLKSHGEGSRLLRWSPDGQWLYVASIGSMSSIWNTRSWEHKKIKNPPGLWVQSACWAPDSLTLLISMAGKSDIHAIRWTDPSVSAELRHDKVFTIPSSLPLESNQQMNERSQSGPIKQIILDPHKGERLVVLFENSDVVHLFAISRPHSLSLNAKSTLRLIGYIRGADISCYDNHPSAAEGSHKIKAMPEATPIIVGFSPSYKSNCYSLASLYSNNTISFVTHSF